MGRRTPAPSLRRLGEFGLIDRFRRHAPPRGRSVLRGIGTDDAAVIRTDRGQLLLLTTDVLAEGVHFDLATASLATVGYKAAVSNISDIAAMGGVPQYMLLALAIPPKSTVAQLDGLFRGAVRACQQYGVDLVGGDTSASQDGFFICITVLGISATTRPLMRTGARTGDLLYVTGTLGDSLAGFRILQAGPQGRRTRTPARRMRHERFLIERHVRPAARIQEGRWLAMQGLATAAMDLSDGLSGDLHHLCAQSRVGAEIDAASVPVSPACRWYAEQHRLDPVGLALVGGEDYELLFTVSPRNRERLERLAPRRGFQITRIGTIRTTTFGIKVTPPSGQLRTLHPDSYQHFRGSVVTPKTARRT